MTREKQTTTGDIYRTFGRLQMLRLLFRAQLAGKAVLAVGFWVGLAALYVWADQAGFGWAVAVLAAMWALMVLPHLVFETSIILDAVGYLFTGRARVYGWLKALPAPQPEDRSTEKARRIARVISIAGMTSPLNALAFWCYGVLIRVPEKAYAKSAKKVLQRKAAPETVQIGGRIYMRGEFLRLYSAASHGEMAFV